MNEIQFKILDQRMINYLPKFATDGSAGMDLVACIDEPIRLKPHEQAFIKTGLSIYIENPNYVGLLTPRSSVGIKKSLKLSNTMGVIDSDFQGELKIHLTNYSQSKIVEIQPFERIAQLLIVPVMQPAIKIVTNFEIETSRGTKGFGSTGRF